MKRTLQILIVLVVVNLLGIGGLWFGYTLIQDKENEEMILRQKIADESEKGNRNIALARTLASVKNDRTELLKFLYDPTEEGQIQFITQIEDLGIKTTGAQVSVPSLVLAKEVPPSLRGDITMKGTWENMFYFLRLLEEFPSRLNVDRYDVRYSATDKIWNGSAKVNLNSLKENT